MPLPNKKRSYIKKIKIYFYIDLTSIFKVKKKKNNYYSCIHEWYGHKVDRDESIERDHDLHPRYRVENGASQVVVHAARHAHRIFQERTRTRDETVVQDGHYVYHAHRGVKKAGVIAFVEIRSQIDAERE